jgi:superfamily I DNA/RNA helicase
MIKEGVNPSEILSLFGVAATAEIIRKNLENELEQPVPDSTVTTFYEFEKNIMKKEWKAIGFDKEPTVISNVENNAVIAEILGTDTDWNAEDIDCDMICAASDVFAAVKIAKKLETDPVCEADYMLNGELGIETVRKIVALYDRYESRLKRDGLIHYEDMDDCVIDFLEDHPEYVETNYGFTHVVVDYRNATLQQIELITKMGVKSITLIVDEDVMPSEGAELI